MKRADGICLIGCGKSKRPGRHPARELYTGSLFRAALQHAEATAERSYILSARYGLVELGQEVESYERQLSPVEANDWARDVAAALVLRHDSIQRLHVTILAGETYAKPISEALRELAPTWNSSRPLFGLTLGERLSWFRLCRIERETGEEAFPDEASATLELPFEAIE